VLGLEHRNQVLVAELVLSAVGRNVMLKFVATCLIHKSRIPFAAEGWNGIRAPMNKNAKLRVLVPFGRFKLLQRLPIGTKWPLLIDAIHIL
jgi:hypothetical protein